MNSNPARERMLRQEEALRALDDFAYCNECGKRCARLPKRKPNGQEWTDCNCTRAAKAAARTTTEGNVTR